MSNYPPGVSGNEPQITGEWRCRSCNAVLPEVVECAGCGGAGCLPPDEFGNRDPCDRCADARSALENGECPGGCDEPDWDAERDRRAEHGEDRYAY